MTSTQAAGATVEVIQDVDNQALASCFLSFVLSDRTGHGDELNEIPLAGLAAMMETGGTFNGKRQTIAEIGGEVTNG